MKQVTKWMTSLALVVALLLPSTALAAPLSTIQPTPEPIGATEDILAMMQEYELRTAFEAQYGRENVPYVYYNGNAVSFGETFPLIKQGSTFVPISAYAQAIGAVVDYMPTTNTVVVTRDGKQVSFVVGSDKVNVAGETVTLPVATFVLNGKTYFPVRLISDAFDLEVVWNELFMEVSVMDIVALKEGIETNYTVMDGLLGMQTPADMQENYFISGSFDMEFTMDGKTIITSSEIDGSSNLESAGYEVNTSVDLSDYEEEFAALFADMTQDPEAVALAETMLKLLKDIRFEFIMDMETFDIYIRSNMFEYLANQLDVDGINNDTWLKITYKDLMPAAQYEELLGMMEELKSGEVVADTEYMLDLMLWSYSELPVQYFNYYEGFETVLDFVSDDKFVKNGNTYVLENAAFDMGGNKFDYKLSVKMGQDGIADSYTFDMGATAEGVVMDLTMNQPNSRTVLMDFNLEIIDAYLGEIHINYEIEMGESNQKPTPIPTENIYDLTKELELIVPIA